MAPVALSLSTLKSVAPAEAESPSASTPSLTAVSPRGPARRLDSEDFSENPTDAAERPRSMPVTRPSASAARLATPMSVAKSSARSSMAGAVDLPTTSPSVCASDLRSATARRRRPSTSRQRARRPVPSG